MLQCFYRVLLIFLCVGSCLQAQLAAPSSTDLTPLSFKTKDYTAEITNGSLTSLQDNKGHKLVQLGGVLSGPLIRCKNKNFSPVSLSASQTADSGQYKFTRFTGLDGAQGDLTVNVDDQSKDLVIVQNATTTTPGLESAEWTIGYIPLDYNIIIPAGGGEIMTKDSPFKQRNFFYAMGWDAQLLVIEGKGHGFYIWGDDTEARPKSVSVERTAQGWRISCRTINPAPFASHTKLDSRRWRINVYEGDWRVPARRYRDWAEKALGPVPLKDQQPAWVKDIRVFVFTMRLELPLLEELAKQLDPKQTLLYLPHWRKQQFDRDAPNYDQYSAELKPFMQRAHELGFHVLLHVNFWGVTPENPLMKEFAPYQVRSEQGKPLFYQNINQKPPLILNYISPASKRWREEFIGRMKKLVADTGTDAIHLDQNFHSHNDGNGLIDGLNFNQGVIAYHKEMREAMPQIALGGEGLNELTYRYLSFAQRHVWSAMGGTIDRAALSVSHPISSYLCQPYVRTYGWLGFPNGHEKPQLYAAWRENYKDWGCFPTFRYEMEISTENLRNPHGFYKQLVEEAKFFQKNQVEPDLDSAWPQDVAFSYRAKDGQPVYWMKDRLLMAGDKEISRTVADVTSVKQSGTIDDWLFYNKENLFGLKSESFYAYFTQPRDLSAFHVDKVPSWLTPDYGRRTDDFLLIRLTQAEIVVADLVKNLGNTECGIRLDNGEKYQETGGISGRNAANLAGAAGTLALTPPSRAALNADLESTTVNHAEATGEVYTSYRVRVPKEGETWFRSEVGMDGRAVRTTKSDGMKFIVRATAGGVTQENAAENKAAERGTLDLDLSRFAGQEMTLELIGQAGAAKDATEDRGIWYQPRILQVVPKNTEPVQIVNAPQNWNYAAQSTEDLKVTRDGAILKLPSKEGITILSNRPFVPTVPGQKLATVPHTITVRDLWNCPIQGTDTIPTIETKGDNLEAFLPVHTKLIADWLVVVPKESTLFRSEIENVTGPTGVGVLVASLAVNDQVVQKVTIPNVGPILLEANLAKWTGQNIVLSLILDGKIRRGDFKLQVQDPRIDSIKTAVITSAEKNMKLLAPLIGLAMSASAIHANTLADWTFDDPGSSPVPIYTSRGQAKIALTSPTPAQAPVLSAAKPKGYEGGSISFEAQKSMFLQGDNTEALNFKMNQAFTIEGWCQLGVPSKVAKQPRVLLSKRDKDGDKIGWTLLVNDVEAGKGTMSFYIHLGKRGFMLESHDPFPLKQWVHFAITRSSDGNLQLFLNGELKDSKNGCVDSLENAGPLLVGRTQFTGSINTFWHGNIYQLRISDEALEPSAFLFKAQ